MKQYSSENGQLILNVNIGYLTAGNLLQNHTILLTGATGGIGSCIAEATVSQGAKIILLGRNRNKLDKLCSKLGENASCICTDLNDVASYDHLIQTAHRFYGPIDSLINNAGISLHEGDFMKVTEQTWDDQLMTNLKSPFFLTQSWVRYYRDQQMKNGRVIMMASDTSGMGSTIPYGLSKAGIASFTYGHAKKLITEGIRVNAIAPGTTLTPMTADFTHGEVCRETTQGKRALFPEEIGQVSVFLLSDLSACVSGNVFGCSEANICFDNIAREQETNP